MELNLSTYPPTKKGSKDILQALLPSIRTLWKAEREQHRTDDLVVIIDTCMNTIRMEPRTITCAKLQKHKTPSLLKDLRRPVPGNYGTLRIWAIIGFSAGNVFILGLPIAPG